METLIIVALFLSAGTSLLLALTFYPLLKTINYSRTKFGRTLFSFLRNMTVLQGLSALLPSLILMAAYNVIDPTATQWLFLIGSAVILVENFFVGYYAMKAYLYLKNESDEHYEEDRLENGKSS